ncbi:alpha/beta hydrolase [Aquimarina sp. AD10]|uniref:alpha/beta fold hydrolase n=1 Tax=Aquimarina sp. AD10 TaxID=1714849 RepID=UPI000E4D06B7|nr:alpha/beta hydrolase [Aquimarina sp. AD10]AXT62020.1 alpha/beta hydrolase [Aquimarina sp. AD10]RKN02479.1 alpha/beta fold hydrolase [Aquimarina sp. AD10]
MQKFFVLILTGVLLFSCKPYENTKIRKNQITYEDFRADQRLFPTDDGLIKYVDQGKGPVIVLLHGVPTSGWLYRKMIKPLVDSGYRVIIPDMLGYGSSDSPDGFELYNAENHAKRLLELMASLGIEKWSHVMHDAGGLWTWELMRKAPDKIEKLIVLNTIIYEEGFYPPVRMKPGGMAKTAMWAYRNGVSTNTLLKSLFKQGLKENTLNSIDVEGYKTPLLEGKTKAMYYFFSQTCNELPDYSDVFENVTVPVSVIWGIHDTMLQWPPQQTRAANALNVKNEDIHIVDEKHFIQETKAEEISYKIMDFIRK